MEAAGQYLKWKTDFECLDESRTGIVNADDQKQTPEENDEVVVQYGIPIERVALQFQMKVAGPDEAQHGPREITDKAHENCEMGNGYCHQDCGDDDAHAECQTPDFELAVEGPNCGEDGFRS